MDAGWFEPIRAYCERTEAGFWAEPLNAVSNAAFLVAAALAGRRALRGFKAEPEPGAGPLSRSGEVESAKADRVRGATSPARPGPLTPTLSRTGEGARRGSSDTPSLPVFDPAALALSLLIAVVGIGSFLFHTLAVRWAMLADVIPIALFIYAYFLLAMRRFLGLGIGGATIATLLFAAAGFGLTPTLDAATGASAADLSNGSVDYLPAALALLGVAAALLRPGCRDPARREAGLRLLAIAGLFLLSLTLRSLDRALCPSLPHGTHALWHVLNAGVLYGLVAVALRLRARTAGQGP
ncbi:ceramidase domain-containing protein [Methylobacterium nigriterrae]|uniref:ceramidase domain-containing protein n=1 Tax=Methylobacterium nigriterrae TaxID=3127512 RepID=UPI003D67A075